MLLNYKFRIATASAILSVLYPNDFSVYDYRVCEILNDFSDISHLTNFDNIWNHYSKYLKVINETVPSKNNFREKDKSLWGQSFYNQLQFDIKNKFKKC